MKVLIKEDFPVEVLILLEFQALSHLEFSTGGCINWLSGKSKIKQFGCFKEESPTKVCIRNIDVGVLTFAHILKFIMLTCDKI